MTVSLAIIGNEEGPYPRQTLVIHRDDTTGIVRRWDRGDAERCRRCSVGCKAKYGTDGIPTCYVEVRGHIDEELCPTLSF